MEDNSMSSVVEPLSDILDTSYLDDFATCIEENLRFVATYDQRDVFQVLREYQNCARRKAMDIVDSDLAGDFQDNPEFQKVELESRFWALAYELYTFRHSEPKEVLPEYEYVSAAIKQENQLRRNPKLRENWIILGWLQDSLVMPKEPKDLHGSRWMYTKVAVKKPSNLADHMDSSIPRSYGLDSLTYDKNDLVTELDPDAPIRQQKKIMKTDEVFDRTLHKYIFELLRARKFDEALKICENTSNFTLKLSISGLNEYLDPLIDGKLLDLDETARPQGNERKSLWKKMCLNLARHDSNIDLYERGIYGILGGDLDSVIALCNTWETQFIAFMLFIVTTDDEDISQNTGIQDPRKVLDILANSSNPVVKGQSESPLRSLMGAVINDTVEFISQSFSEHLQLFSNNPAEEVDESVLRIMTHFLIFLRHLDIEIGDSKDYVIILTSYIEFLHFHKKQYLIPLYISYLPDEDSITTYAKILVGVTDSEQRSIHLKLAKKYNLDINNSIRKAAADVFHETELAYGSNNLTVSSSPTNAVDDTDRRLYRTIEWFIDASLWADALHSIVSLYQLLLGKGKFEAAYQFGSKISCETILKMYDTNLSVNLEHVEVILDNNERIQILEYDKLISILADIKLWSELLQELKTSSKFVSSNPPKQWREKTLVLVRELAAKVTEFSAKWMIKSIHAYREVDPETANLLSGLRLLYVPFVILELARIYIEAQVIHPAFLKEAANLSNMVSGEDLKLYELFMESGTLGTFLDCMAQAVTDGVANGEKGIYD